MMFTCIYRENISDDACELPKLPNMGKKSVE